METLEIGDRVQSADFNGTVSISPVVFLPHKSNDELTTFLEVTTESGKVLLPPLRDQARSLSLSLSLSLHISLTL